MTVRVFDGVDDQVRFHPTFRSVTAWTMAVLVKRAGDNADEATPLALLGGGGTARWVMFFSTTTGNIGFWNNGAFDTGGAPVSAPSGWAIAVNSKGPGTVVPRSHTFPIGGAWTHQNGVNAGGDNTLLIDETVFGRNAASSGWFEGKVAVAAQWDSQLTDLQVEALATNLRTRDWTEHSVSPGWVVEPGSNTPVRDLIGTAHSTSIAGTTLDAADDPPGWGFVGALPLRDTYTPARMRKVA